MNIARIVFGTIYLLGAVFNIFIVVTEGWQTYIGFAEYLNSVLIPIGIIL